LRQDLEYALKVISKFSRINDRDVLLESYRTSVPQISTRPYVKKEIVGKALKMGAEPEKFYDNSFVKALDGLWQGLFHWSRGRS
jgi:hypothetical protein